MANWKGVTIIRTPDELEAAIPMLRSLPFPMVLKVEPYIERPGKWMKALTGRAIFPTGPGATIP